LNKKFTYILFALALGVFLFATVFVLLHKKNIQPLTKSWEKPVPNQITPANLVSIRAEDCGTCHKDHYAEWQMSTHAHAWTDEQFQAEIMKASSPYFCINCHIPLQNQQEFIVTGLENGDIYKPVKVKNVLFDRKMQQEGISCASCHVRDGAIIGAQNLKNAPHKVVYAPEKLSESMCISCHNANAVVTAELVCTFETGDEWKAGPYFGKKNCLSCHMEEVERPLVAGYPSRKSHRHYVPGSGIPKHKNLKTMGLNGLEIAVADKGKLDLKTNVWNLKASLTNTKAGHRVPSGDPERFILVTYILKNESGNIVQTLKHRIGEIWEWYPKAKKLADNNIDPLETRPVDFTSKALPAGKYQLEVKITKNRMDQKTATYSKISSDYPLGIDMFEKNINFKVDN
jgi:nitrate reductase cytochrome c-type subunit